MTVSIPYRNSGFPIQDGEEVRMFQYNGRAWEDVTSAPYGDNNSVTGTVGSMGPIVAALKSSST